MRFFGPKEQAETLGGAPDHSKNKRLGTLRRLILTAQSEEISGLKPREALEQAAGIADVPCRGLLGE